MALTAEQAYALSKKYTNDSMAGGGAVAGKNCTIKSIDPITGGNRITFEWTLDDGTIKNGTLDVMDGVQGPQGPEGDAGLGIKSVTVNAQDHLIVTYDDDTTQDAGQIQITAAVDSVNGKTGEVELDASDVGAYSTTEVDTALDGKVDKVTGKGLSTNDYDNASKTIVDGITTALADKADKDDVIDGASYDSTNHSILFKKGTTTLFSLDAAAFVKDGMVDTVTITGGNLVITFNTDAGKQAISIPLTDIFDPANYYDKDDVDELLADKADKTDVDSAIAEQQSLLKDTVGWTGKNLLRNTAITHIVSGVTLTANADGSINVDGTATSDIIEEIGRFAYIDDTVILSGCPAGGAWNTYRLDIRNDSNVQYDNYMDTGSGIEFTPDSSYLKICIRIANGTNISNLTFYPMLRYATVSDSTYEAYHESVEVMYEEEIHGVNLFNDSKIEVGKAWNGDTNANRARNIIPCEPNSEYIVSMNGTNGLDAVFFSVSASIPPSSQTAITSFPYTIRTGASDRYITLGFNKTNIALSNVTALKIMLRKAAIEDPAYRPYNYQAIQNQIDAQGVLGAKNLLEPPSEASTQKGITYTPIEKGKVQVTGTLSESATSQYNYKTLYASEGILEAGKTYILNKGVTEYAYIIIWFWDVNGTYITGVNSKYNNGDIVFTVPSNTYRINYVLEVSLHEYGKTVNDVLELMLRLASDPDDTYVPYAMTNRELTENKLDKTSTVLTSSNNLDDVRTTGIYYWKDSIPTNTPENITYAMMEVVKHGDNVTHQIIKKGEVQYQRIYSGNPLAWKSWYKFTGTVVS